MRESTEKYITFTVPIEKKVTRFDKNGEEISKYASYRVQFIDSVRFMESSLSNLDNDLSEGIHRIKCKYWHSAKKCEILVFKYKWCDCSLELTNFEDD